MLWTILIVIHILAGLTMVLLFFAYRSPRFAANQIAPDPQRSVDPAKLRRDAILNATVSPVLIFATCGLLQDQLFYAGEAPLWLMIVEGLVAYLIYDFAYYFMHRYAFHEWKLMRAQHAVHHAARHPTAIDSLLLHPSETAAGLLLFFSSIAVIGGVHLHTFAVMMLIYTQLNIFNHAGLAFERGPLKLLGRLSVKHDRHHHSMLSGNYASITPLPDIVFGTVE